MCPLVGFDAERPRGGCSDPTHSSDLSDLSDLSDPSDPSDLSDLSDLSDSSDPSDLSDLSDPSDPSEVAGIRMHSVVRAAGPGELVGTPSARRLDAQPT